jgi:hypothetical protein
MKHVFDVKVKDLSSLLLAHWFIAGLILTLKMEMIRSSETLVHVGTKRRHISEDGYFQLAGKLMSSSSVRRSMPNDKSSQSEQKRSLPGIIFIITLS